MKLTVVAVRVQQFRLSTPHDQELKQPELLAFLKLSAVICHYLMDPTL